MTNSMLAKHSQGKFLKDPIFVASGAANKAIATYGKDKVINGTIGAIMNDAGELACLPTVEKVLRSVPTRQLAGYAPIAGTPDYLEAVKTSVFFDQRPDGYMNVVATAGGTGAIHNTIYNYTDIGDTVLTSDWFWGTYSSICVETARKFTTYKLFDENLNYNLPDLQLQVEKILAQQDALLLIINSPAHNPTGYNLTHEDWDGVIDLLKTKAADKTKRLTLLVDIAYIDYAGEKNEVRSFMKKFGNLPENILVVFAFSMSKGHTLYGQRTGAMIGLSAKKSVADEFLDASKFTSRCVWSNINHAAMTTLATINNDASLMASYEKERNALNEMVQKRGKVFMAEAQACGLNALPYKGGFFISVPYDEPEVLAAELQKELVFVVPLKKGIRVAACSISEKDMHGVAAKVLKAVETLQKNK